MIKPIYLSGRIQGITRGESSGWRDHATGLLLPKQQIINPMDRVYDGQNYDHIVTSDIVDVSNSRALLVRFDQPSVGTSMEIRIAFQFRIPVYVWYDTDQEISPWLIYHTSKFFDSLEEACKHILSEIM